MLGVASVVLRAAGCSFPKPPAELISLWALDETSPTGGVFDDVGPADVSMAMVGTWADLTTASMVQGVGGSSAYTDGTAYATIAANDPAHGLSALTVSFYYQRDSATAKQILLAAGDGTQQGDFSIEILPDGTLRGYHVGQDGALRFFENSSGISGTHLQIGRAHRIDLTLGPQGAHIYLDGAELAAAAIFANRNSWNNARVKYLGRWTDGSQAPADGAFDRIRVWNQQLTNAEIALLEPAQSIEIGGAPPASDELSVPSLAEWLPSDETDPTPTKYVSNQSRGNGSGSSPAHAQEVQDALDGASPGDVLLAVCQTPGTVEFWDYPSGLSFPSGSSGNLITLQARNGDGVVISAGEDFAGARFPNSGFWTQSGLSQADIDKQIWRSTGTFPGGAQNLMGMWLEFDHPHQIVRAGSMTNLRATYGTADSPTSYCGPCAHKDTDGRVYIRFQRPHVGKYSFHDKWSPNTWPGFPEAISNGQLVYPISENPNDYVIHLYRTSSQVDAFNCGQYAKIGSGINSLGFASFLDGTAHIQMHRGLHYTWRCGVKTSASGDTRTDLYFNRMRCTDGCKIHLSRAEWKFGGWLEGIRSFWFSMFNAASASQFYCKDCTIADYHEIMVGNAFADRFRWRNCTFVNIVDDGIQLPNNMSRFEIGYCYFFGAGWGGFGRGGGDGGLAEVPGNFFLHHNIFDGRQERCTDWISEPHPRGLYYQHSPDGGNPLKIYNNLCLYGPDLEQEMGGLGFAHADQNGDGGNNTLTGAALMHEAFNNIVLRVHLEGTKRYDPAAGNNYSHSLQGQSDFALGKCIRYSANHTNELFDYNLYWRPDTMTESAFLDGFRRGTGETVRDFASLAAWKAHAEFAHSKLGGTYRGAYSPGFDGNSTDTKPTLPSIDDYPTSRFLYRPSATSAVTTAKIGSLSGADWWSGLGPTWGRDYFPWNEGAMTLEPSPWKGPLDPNGSIPCVGVQNP